MLFCFRVCLRLLSGLLVGDRESSIGSHHGYFLLWEAIDILFLFLIVSKGLSTTMDTLFLVLWEFLVLLFLFLLLCKGFMCSKLLPYDWFPWPFLCNLIKFLTIIVVSLFASVFGLIARSCHIYSIHSHCIRISPQPYLPCPLFCRQLFLFWSYEEILFKEGSLLLVQPSMILLIKPLGRWHLLLHLLRLSTVGTFYMTTLSLKLMLLRLCHIILPI